MRDIGRLEIVWMIENDPEVEERVRDITQPLIASTEVQTLIQEVVTVIIPNRTTRKRALTTENSTRKRKPRELQ